MPSDDINLKGTLGFLATLVATVAVAYGVLTLLTRAWEQSARRADAAALAQLPPAGNRPYFPLPREQPNPLVDLETVRARENAELNSYGWIDRTNGVVRIPIDRAIEILTQQTKGTP